MKHTYESPKLFVMFGTEEDILTGSSGLSLDNVLVGRTVECSNWKTTVGETE